MLEDHANANRDRVRWRGETDLMAIDGDGSAVRLLHAVQDLHQRRFASAILTDQRVDRAGSDRDVNVMVGDHARKSFADPTEFDGWHSLKVFGQVDLLMHISMQTARATRYRAARAVFGYQPLIKAS